MSVEYREIKIRREGGDGSLTNPSISAQSSEGDIAFEILKARGGLIHYTELVEEILKRKGLPNEPKTIASVLTQINLDTRFSYFGQGEWGLKTKSNSRNTRRIPTITLMNKSYEDDRDEPNPYEKDELDEQDLDSITFDRDDIEPEIDDYDEVDVDRNRDDWEE